MAAVCAFRPKTRTRLGGSGVIDKAEQEAAKRSRPENFTAYELYLAGHSEHLRLNQDGNKNAIELLEKAVAADPRLARAWAELSTARQASTNYGADPTLANSAALAAARSAVEIDPRDAMAHAQLAFALAMKGDFAPNGAEFDTALRLNPGDAEVLAMYAAWPSSFGHPEHGAEAADHAIRLNPNYQVWQAWNFSWAYFARSIRRHFAHPGTAPERQLPRLLLGAARRELCGARPVRGSEGGHVGCASTLPRPDHRGLHRDRGQQRRRPNPAHRADAGRGIPGLREARDPGEKPTIGAAARMPVEMNLARRFWRKEAFLGLSVKRPGSPICDAAGSARRSRG